MPIIFPSMKQLGGLAQRPGVRFGHALEGVEVYDVDISVSWCHAPSSFSLRKALATGTRFVLRWAYRLSIVSTVHVVFAESLGKLRARVGRSMLPLALVRRKIPKGIAAHLTLF